MKETPSEKRNIKPIKTFKSKHIARASFITSHDEKLFIGTFDTYGAPSKVFVFDLKDENKLLNSFLIPNYVQGITFYNGYMLLSRSYGRHCESELCIYEYNVKENN